MGSQTTGEEGKRKMGSKEETEGEGKGREDKGGGNGREREGGSEEGSRTRVKEMARRENMTKGRRVKKVKEKGGGKGRKGGS